MRIVLDSGLRVTLKAQDIYGPLLSKCLSPREPQVTPWESRFFGTCLGVENVTLLYEWSPTIKALELPCAWLHPYRPDITGLRITLESLRWFGEKTLKIHVLAYWASCLRPAANNTLNLWIREEKHMNRLISSGESRFFHTTCSAPIRRLNQIYDSIKSMLNIRQISNTLLN